MPSDNPVLVYFRFWMTAGFLLVLLVVYLSLTSVPLDIGLDFRFLDKLSHSFAYLVLMLWFSMMVFIFKSRLMIALVLVVLGATLEFIQGMGPYRYFEVGDMVANTAGVMTGLLLASTRLKYGLVWVEAHVHGGKL